MTYRKMSLRPLNALLKQALQSRVLKRTAIGFGAFAPAFAIANPTGGVVVGGNASITAPDANHTIINQASQNAILNWQQFSIGSNQYVQFIQPDSSAVVLNRVIGGDPSQILGNLSANGQVFLVNPNGVFFGQGASLDVQGLVATTFDIKDTDFMAGHYVFAKGSGAPDAGVVNQGTLTANSGYIVLAGDYASNDGVISAQAGQVVLASGNQMTLTLDTNSLVSFVVDQATLAQYAGVSNTGTIEADGGIVLMTAKVANALTATAVNNSGLITAHSVQDHNGTIILAAQGGDINESGTLDASGATDGVAGGNVVIRGDGHTEIASTASINAAGDNANGGFVELSGHTLSVRGNVNLGHGGSLLIDPLKLAITAGGSVAGTASAHSITSGEYLSAQFIQNKLNTGNNVVLVASNSILAATLGAPGATGPATSIVATGTGNLTLKTGTLAFRGTASAAGSLMNFGSLNCTKGVCTPIQGTPLTSVAFTQGNGTINLSGVTINIAGGFTANAGTGTVTLGNTAAKSVSVTGGSVTVGNLTTSGTSGIHLSAIQTLSYGGPAKIRTGSLTTTGGGGVTLIQSHGISPFLGSGGNINVTGAINAAGTVNITAHDTNGPQGGNITLQSVTGSKIIVNTTAKTGANITAVSLHANGAGVSSGVSLSGRASSGAVNGNVKVTSTSGIVSDHGNASVTVHGGGGGITVSGPIMAGRNVSLYGSGALTGFNVTGAISAGGAVTISESGTVTGASTLKTGNVTAGNSANINVYQVTGASKVTIGNITAGARAYVSNNVVAGGSANLTLGNVSGRDVQIYDHAVAGQQAVLQTGALSAINPSSAAFVNVTTGGKNDIITTGAITATGTLNPNRSPLTQAGFNRSAANVSLIDVGSGNALMTVNGGISIKATGAHYNLIRSGSNAFTASGSTGQALLNISTGSGPAGLATVKVTGAIDETGMGIVGANIIANKVTLGGTVNITATAAKMKQTGTLTNGALENIKYSESGAALGRATLFVQTGSAASFGGAVTLSGPSAGLFVNGTGGVTTRGITVTANGQKFNHKATGTDSLGKAVNYSSSQSVGNATAFLEAGAIGNPKTVNVQGNVSVTGKDRAGISVAGNTIAMQGITVTQTAGKFSRTGIVPSGVFTASSGGPNPLALVSQQNQTGGGLDRLFGINQGTLTGGFAGVQLMDFPNTSSCSCQTPANSITVNGNIAMSVAGDGEVWLTGKAVSITGGINGVATRATVNGTGTQNFNSGGINYSVAHTVTGSGGRMHLDIRGIPGATSGGSSNNYTGTVTIGGAISLTGPTADIRIKSGSIKTGDITANGTGEKLSVTDVYTPTGTGTAFTLKRSGIIEWSGIDLNGKASTGIITTGNLLAEGPLFAGIHVGAGTVTVGNLGVIASNGSVTLLDTRISTTPLSFTAGDAGIAVSAVTGTGKTAVFGAAKVNGNINIEATRDVHLLTNAVVSGYTLVTAGGTIDDPLPANILRFLNQKPGNQGGSSSHVSTLNLSTSALALLAGGNISLTDATLKVGAGSVPGVAGDSTGIALLAKKGLATSTAPSATIVAGGTLGLGNFTSTGGYLFMEAGTYNLSGPISVPTSTVVQFAPVVLSGSIGVEPGTSTSSQLNLSGSLLNLFPGTTLLIGGAGTIGAVTIGTQGTITLNNGSNFLVFTTGSVTGLDKILTTGLVGNLLELVNFQIPTASEIQNTSSTDQKKNVNTGGEENGDSGGTIEQDNDTSGVCHG